MGREKRGEERGKWMGVEDGEKERGKKGRRKEGEGQGEEENDK